MSITTPTLSIITVSFNAATSIAKTLASVAAQTYPKIEYIVVDGGSTDGTLAILEASRSAIDILISEPDTGIYNAMNKGAAVANGEYLLFLNADDYFFDAEVLARAVREMQRLGLSDIYFGDVQIFDPVSGKASIWQPRRVSAESLYRSTIPHPASFISKAVFSELSGYDESMKISADHDFFVRAFVSNKSFKYLNTLVAVFSLGGVSTTSKFKQLMFEERKRSIQSNFSSWECLLLSFRVRLRKIFYF